LHRRAGEGRDRGAARTNGDRGPVGEAGAVAAGDLVLAVEQRRWVKDHGLVAAADGEGAGARQLALAVRRSRARLDLARSHGARLAQVGAGALGYLREERRAARAGGAGTDHDEADGRRRWAGASIRGGAGVGAADRGRAGVDAAAVGPARRFSVVVRG